MKTLDLDELKGQVLVMRDVGVAVSKKDGTVWFGSNDTSLIMNTKVNANCCRVH